MDEYIMKESTGTKRKLVSVKTLTCWMTLAEALDLHKFSQLAEQ
jgi:hypothetical protein